MIIKISLLTTGFVGSVITGICDSVCLYVSFPHALYKKNGLSFQHQTRYRYGSPWQPLAVLKYEIKNSAVKDKQLLTL